jgi:hypothetical protein
VAAAWAAIIAVIVTIYFGCQAHQDAHPQVSSSNNPAQQSMPGTETSRHLGDKLSSCSQDLAFGDVVSFYNDGKCAKVASSSSWERHDLIYSGHGSNGDPSFSVFIGSGLLAMSDATTASYQGCVSDTRYAAYLAVPEGSVLCFTGYGMVAGIKLVEHHSSPTDYVTLDITVWQGK